MDRANQPPCDRPRSRVRVSAPQGERGAVLLAALCFATVLTIALSSYVTLCYRSLELSTRSLNSNRSRDLAEAGIEDGLWALNKWDFSGYTVVGSVATKTVTGFSYDNGATGQISVRISYDGQVVITATGSVSRPNGPTATRTLTSTCARSPLFVNAVAATTGTVKFTSAGTSAVVDSYNSSSGDYTAQSAGYSATIAAGSSSLQSATVQLTNAQVKGYVATLGTGPSYGTSAVVLGPSTPFGTRIDDSRLSTSPYQPVFDIKAVTGTGTTLTTPGSNSTLTIGSSNATTPSIFYSNGIDMTGTAKIIVQGPVKIMVSGPLYVGLNGGTPSIEVKTTGSLEMVVSGDIAIYGAGIVNASRLPSRVAIHGTNSLTVPDMNTTSDFHGVIYTPNGDFKVWSNNAIYGAIIARNVTFSGSAPLVHYDVNLRSQVFSGLDIPYSVSKVYETGTGG